MGKLGDFVIKQLEKKIEIKKILDSENFMNLITKMGIQEDWESLSEILSTLNENKVEVNFKETDYDNYQFHKRIVQYYKLYNNILFRKNRMLEINKRIDLIKPEIDMTFLESYRNDDES